MPPPPHPTPRWRSFFCMYIPIFFFLCVCACTQLVFMWGNLGLASEDRREVPVPLLLPGQVGVVSVAFVAPVMEGMYTSHWRLAHCGCQFGPRVWCSIVVDTGSSRSALWQQSKPPASLLSGDSCVLSMCGAGFWSGMHDRIDQQPVSHLHEASSCVCLQTETGKTPKVWMNFNPLTWSFSFSLYILSATVSLQPLTQLSEFHWIVKQRGILALICNTLQSWRVYAFNINQLILPEKCFSLSESDGFTLIA